MTYARAPTRIRAFPVDVIIVERAITSKGGVEGVKCPLPLQVLAHHQYPVGLVFRAAVFPFATLPFEVLFPVPPRRFLRQTIFADFQLILL